MGRDERADFCDEERVDLMVTRVDEDKFGGEACSEAKDTVGLCVVGGGRHVVGVFVSQRTLPLFFVTIHVTFAS